MEALVPFTESGGSAAAFVTTANEPHLGNTIIRYVEEFVPGHCGERYSPHITLGVGTEEFVRKLSAKPFEDFAFSPAEDRRLPARRPGHRAACPFELAAASHLARQLGRHERPLYDQLVAARLDLRLRPIADRRLPGRIPVGRVMRPSTKLL